jgi:hypothetical protein
MVSGKDVLRKCQTSIGNRNYNNNCYEGRIGPNETGSAEESGMICF